MITIDEKYYIDLDNKAIEKYGIKFDELTSGQKAYISKVINGNQRT
jgi:S-adenosylhomocysteine hydrolase